jgi:hypothetical protein
LNEGFGVIPHNLIKFLEFSRPEENTGEPKLEILFREPEGFEKGSTEEAWVEGGEFWWEEALVGCVEGGEMDA